MKKHRILFVCVHNSARSQMAEAFLNELGGDDFSAESAGLEPGTLNSYVVEAMAEIGIDISGNPTKAVFELLKVGKTFDTVITVCDTASAERCPLFPGVTKRIAWSFPDPSGFKGTKEEIITHIREVRGEIRKMVTDFMEEAQILKFWM